MTEEAQQSSNNTPDNSEGRSIIEVVNARADELLTAMKSLQFVVKVEGGSPTSPTNPTTPDDPVKPPITPPVTTPVTPPTEAPKIPPLVNGKVQTLGNFGINWSSGEFGDVRPGVYGVNYIYPQEKHFKAWFARYINRFRIPVRAERLVKYDQFKPVMAGDQATWLKEFTTEWDPDALKRLTDMFDAAQRQGCSILLDLHNFGFFDFVKKDNGLAITNPMVLELYTDLVQLIAKTFGTHPAYEGLDIMNEPMLSEADWYPIAQKLVDAYRKHDMKSVLVIEGVSYSGCHSWYKANTRFKIVDPANNYYASGHQYFDTDASGNYDKPFESETAKFQPDPQLHGVRVFTSWIKLLKDKGLRPHVGEYNVPNRSAWGTSLATMKNWVPLMENAMEVLEKENVPSYLWGCGDWWPDNSAQKGTNVYPMKTELATDTKPENFQVTLMAKYNEPKFKAALAAANK